MVNAVFCNFVSNVVKIIAESVSIWIKAKDIGDNWKLAFAIPEWVLKKNILIR
jgi:hypothetical protein